MLPDLWGLSQGYNPTVPDQPNPPSAPKAKPDTLRIDPVLARQLDEIGDQLAADRDSLINEALMEMSIERDELSEPSEPRAIDTETYDEDRANFTPPKLLPKQFRRDTTPRIDGHLVTTPNAKPDARGVSMVGPVRVEQPKPMTALEITEQAERRALRKAEDNAYLDKMSNAFIESLGELDELKEAMALSGIPKFEQFLSDLANPRYKAKKWTVTTLATKNGIKPSELGEIFRRHQLAKGTTKMLVAMPKLADDILQDAMSSMVCCERCDGLGVLEETKKDANGNETVRHRDCPECKGFGEVRKAGSTDARKFVLESNGLINKKTPLVQNNLNVGTSYGVGSHADDIEDFSNGAVIDVTANDE